jgi:MurNAc alpha-1-phosphate uridylyltransferase
MADLKTAMLLAAGRGERLRPYTDHTPKPLIEVRGKPLLEHQLGWLAKAGVEHAVINLHHLAEQIETFCARRQSAAPRISFSVETQLLETGGGIVNALPLLGETPFLLLNGDIFTDFPLAELHSLPDWADVHLLITPTPAYREQGDFEFSNGRITSRGSSYVYCGIAVLRPSLFANRAPGAFSLRDLYFQAIDRGTISAQVWGGYWIDIGTPEQLEAVNSAPR